MMMGHGPNFHGLRPLVDLSVAEAHAILIDRLGRADVPDLDSVENEDWGRDLVLSRLHDLSDDELAALGLTRDDAPADEER
jgi:hypothetical protein